MQQYNKSNKNLRQHKKNNNEILELVESSFFGSNKYKFNELTADIDIEKLVKIPNNEILWLVNIQL